MRLTLSDETRDLGATFEARKREVSRLKLRKRRAIVVEMLRLPAYRLLPRQAEPGEVFIDCSFEFRPASSRVDVLDAEEQPPSDRERHVGVEQCGQRVAEMQVAV